MSQLFKKFRRKNHSSNPSSNSININNINNNNNNNNKSKNNHHSNSNSHSSDTSYRSLINKNGINGHGVIDPHINFSISSADQQFPSVRSNQSCDPSELKVFWTQPVELRRTLNPVFVNEPVDFYEDFIPLENTQDFYLVPRYRKTDENIIVSNEPNDTSLTRSISLGNIPTFDFTDENLSLIDVKKKRREARLNDLHQENDLYPVTNLKRKQSLPEHLNRIVDAYPGKLNLPADFFKRDSGVVTDDELESQLQTVHNAIQTNHNTSGYPSDESGTDSLSVEENTITLASSRENLRRNSNLSNISFEERDNKYETKINKGAWLRSRNSSLDGETFLELTNGKQQSFVEDIDDILDISLQEPPKRSYSAPINSKRRTEVSFSSQGKQRLKSEDLFFSVEQILSDLQTHLDNELSDGDITESEEENKHILDTTIEEEQEFTVNTADNTYQNIAEISSGRSSIFGEAAASSPPNSGIFENITSVRVPLAGTSIENQVIKSDIESGILNFYREDDISPSTSTRELNTDVAIKRSGSLMANTTPAGTFLLTPVENTNRQQKSNNYVTSAYNNAGARPKTSMNSQEAGISSQILDQQEKLNQSSKLNKPINKNRHKSDSPMNKHSSNNDFKMSREKFKSMPENLNKTKEVPQKPPRRISMVDNSNTRSPHQFQRPVSMIENFHGSSSNINSPSNSPSFNFSLPSDGGLEEEDKNFVDSYLSVQRSTNTVTSNGMTVLRRDSSSAGQRPNKKKTIEDILLEGADVYPDRACKRTIMSLMVRCYNYGSDCDWTGELGDLQDHLDQCQLIPVTCINACGRVDIPRNTMMQHVDVEGDCPLAVVNCRYGDMGCKFKARRVDIEQHMKETTEQHLELAHMRIRELEVRQENICMNGKFLWKITNYEHLVKQSATKKEKEKLCSPPFYTGQYGYKLRAEAFLNGLGQGKGSHLSLYVVIMKGEYDAILPWPFKQNVDFVLIDQDDDVTSRQNKIWKLSCERNSDYFKRPNKSKSLGFGCPKFVSLETLRTKNYIKDQTLFIKIEVEPTDGVVFGSQTKPTN